MNRLSASKPHDGKQIKVICVAAVSLLLDIEHRDKFLSEAVKLCFEFRVVP